MIMVSFVSFEIYSSLMAASKSQANIDYESDHMKPSDHIQYLSLFFADDQRVIDFVLVWQAIDDPDEENENFTKRMIFEQNLVNEGLELEREIIEGIHFTKIHTPFKVLRRYSEILKLRMPMKEVSV